MAEKRKFKTGDIVKLKSGGPQMTVKEYLENEVNCQWFDESKVRDEKFFEDSIELSPRRIEASLDEIISLLDATREEQALREETN